MCEVLVIILTDLIPLNIDKSKHHSVLHKMYTIMIYQLKYLFKFKRKI
jgi:hypothetical protein